MSTKSGNKMRFAKGTLLASALAAIAGSASGCGKEMLVCADPAQEGYWYNCPRGQAAVGEGGAGGGISTSVTVPGVGGMGGMAGAGGTGGMGGIGGEGGSTATTTPTGGMGGMAGAGGAGMGGEGGFGVGGAGGTGGMGVGGAGGEGGFGVGGAGGAGGAGGTGGVGGSGPSLPTPNFINEAPWMTSNCDSKPLYVQRNGNQMWLGPITMNTNAQDTTQNTFNWYCKPNPQENLPAVTKVVGPNGFQFQCTEPTPVMALKAIAIANDNINGIWNGGNGLIAQPAEGGPAYIQATCISPSSPPPLWAGEGQTCSDAVKEQPPLER